MSYMRSREEVDALLAKRDSLYQMAKAQHPERWRGAPRNWSPVGTVLLNPEQPATTEPLAA